MTKTHYYLGDVPGGAIVARSSTRSDFTHAAVDVRGLQPGQIVRAGQSGWSTHEDGAAKNYMAYWTPEKRREQGRHIVVVRVRRVSSAEFRAAGAK